ncbi:MAG: hypothetical protein ACK500_00465 [Flavobacteriales bacterium]
MKKNVWLLLVLVALGALAWWMYQRNSSSTLADQPLSDFAIEDTAAVNKIFIVDHQGQTALLERVPGERLWNLNGKYKARHDAVNLILETLNRLRVRGNVPLKGQENMLRVLASSGKKVEVYQGGDKPSKIYYVGPATPDHVGTIMLLEIPGLGRSSEPYITHLEGFTGFLTPRFFANEMEWRYTGIFEYPKLDFKQVDVVFHGSAENSFSVKYNGGNDISLYAGRDPISGAFRKKVEQFDSTRVRDFLLLFKKVHIESYNTYLKPTAEDSIRKTIPLFTITLRDANDKAHAVDLYAKKGKEPRLNALGVMSPWDPEYYWARTEENYMGLAQMYVFDPVVQPLPFYTGQIIDPVPGIRWIK